MMGSEVIGITTFQRQDAENRAEASLVSQPHLNMASVSQLRAYADAMKVFKPRVFILIGLAICVGGFVYDMIFAGIPYQDPSPEVYANWRYHSRIGSNVVLFGLVVLLLGLMWGATAWIKRRFMPSN